MTYIYLLLKKLSKKYKLHYRPYQTSPILREESSSVHFPNSSHLRQRDTILTGLSQTRENQEAINENFKKIVCHM